MGVLFAIFFGAVTPAQAEYPWDAVQIEAQSAAAAAASTDTVGTLGTGSCLDTIGGVSMQPCAEPQIRPQSFFWEYLNSNTIRMRMIGNPDYCLVGVYIEGTNQLPTALCDDEPIIVAYTAWILHQDGNLLRFQSYYASTWYDVAICLTSSAGLATCDKPSTSFVAIRRFRL